MVGTTVGITLRGMTTSLKERFLELNNSGLNPRIVYRCVQQDNYGCKYSPVNGKQDGISMKNKLQIRLDLGS